MQEQRTAEAVDAASLEEDLHVVSNREPYRHAFDGDGDVCVDRPTGGLTAGLDPVMQRLGGTWTAWGDGEADYVVGDGDNAVEVPPEDPAFTLQRIPLSSAEVAGYYEGYANSTLWPLCHTATGAVEFDHEDFETYRDVNRRFAEVVASGTDDDTTVWFQDYHFALAPRFLRDDTDAFLMQFWHVPWPAADVFRVTPNAERLLDGLLANDLLGFHTPRYCSNFLESAEALLEGAVVDWGDREVHYGDRTTRVEAFPMGVDGSAIARAADANPDAGTRFRREHGINPDRRLVLGVDRLDYTKGLVERLEALEHLWETRPHLRGAFTYVQEAEESRGNIPAYQRLQDAVESTVERVDDRFGTDDWRPVVLTTEHLPNDELHGLYRAADVCLVTPLRDGMNLVAKEYVAAQVDDDGALVLSEFAGASEALADGAIPVNPHDTPACADAVERALGMGADERRGRMRSLRRTVHDRDVGWWIESVLRCAADVRRRRRSPA